MAAFADVKSVETMGSEVLAVLEMSLDEVVEPDVILPTPANVGLGSWLLVDPRLPTVAPEGLLGGERPATWLAVMRAVAVGAARVTEMGG